MMDLPVKKITSMGVLLAISVLLGYLELLLAFTMLIPGAKIGLGNLVVLLLIFSSNYNWRDVNMFQLTRVLLCSILFASLLSCVYSLGGMIFSLLAMYIAKEFFHMDIIATSMLGGVFHNIGQVIVAVFLVSKYVILSHLPYLLILGMLAGFCMGILSKLLWKRKLV